GTRRRRGAVAAGHLPAAVDARWRRLKRVAVYAAYAGAGDSEVGDGVRRRCVCRSRRQYVAYAHTQPVNEFKDAWNSKTENVHRPLLSVVPRLMNALFPSLSVNVQ